MCTQPEKEQYQTVITLLETAQETLNIHLIDATKDSDVSKIKNLLNQGANPNTFVDESIPLYYAKTKEVAEALINGGADVNRANTSKLTPLMEAALWGYFEVVTVLLDKGALVDATNIHGSNALSRAIQNVDIDKKNQYIAIIKLLQAKLKAAVITS